MDIRVESKPSGEPAHADIWRHLITVRTSHKTVAFTRSFSLRGIDEVQAAGNDTVETHEDSVPGLSVPT
jgi:hypothetical protein